MNLKIWIRQTGPTEVSQLLGVNRATVYAWLRGSIPGEKVARKIVAETPVTFAGLYGESAPLFDGDDHE